jgi:hypothetical protein
MAEGAKDEQTSGVVELDVPAAIAALETRVTELEAVVHTMAQGNPYAGHGVVVAWLEKVGARIKAAVEKVV